MQNDCCIDNSDSPTLVANSRQILFAYPEEEKQKTARAQPDSPVRPGSHKPNTGAFRPAALRPHFSVSLPIRFSLNSKLQNMFN